LQRTPDVYFIAKRLAIAMPTLLILIIFLFILMFAAPGGPFGGERPPPAAVLANIEARYGLDQPYIVQM
jgi:oligopeptide transport system permease protein